MWRFETLDGQFGVLRRDAKSAGSRGHLVQLSQLMAQGGGDWSLFKADREAAYRQRPIDPADQRFAIVALRRPTTHLWYGFATRTFLFGPVAAVLRYDGLSRILASLADRCLGISLVAYFDDFAALIRRALGDRALATSTRFSALFGFRLNSKKSMVGPAVSFRGFLGDFQPLGIITSWRSLSRWGKRKSWSGPLGGFLKVGRISQICLGGLTEKLSFSQTSLFGKFARAQMRPLYTKLNRRVLNARLSTWERSVFTCRAQAIADFTPRLDIHRPHRPDWLIYTDAAADPPALCALLFAGRRSFPRRRIQCASTSVPVSWPHLFRLTSLISGLELSALVLFMEDWALSFGEAAVGST